MYRRPSGQKTAKGVVFSKSLEEIKKYIFPALFFWKRCQEYLLKVHKGSRSAFVEHRGHWVSLRMTV